MLVRAEAPRRRVCCLKLSMLEPILMPPDDIWEPQIHAEDTHATHRIWGCAGRNACGQQHGPRSSSELDTAAREPALSVEMGCWRRARLRQPHEATNCAQRSQADQDRRGHRTRIRAQCEY